MIANPAATLIWQFVSSLIQSQSILMLASALY
jgi:hypothetical protein